MTATPTLDAALKSAISDALTYCGGAGTRGHRAAEELARIATKLAEQREALRDAVVAAEKFIAAMAAHPGETPISVCRNEAKALRAALASTEDAL